MTRNRRTRLGMESLENRRLLAVAAFEAELYDDVDGNPGALIADNTVTAGETFFLRVTAQEFDRFRDGLRSAAVDIDWDAGLLSAVEADFQLDSVITADLPLLQGGSLDNQAGSIDDLSGTALLSSGTGRAIGNNAADTFAMIRMQAGLEPGETTIELGVSESKKTVTVPTAVVSENQLRFDVQTLLIAPAGAMDASVPVNSEPAAAEPEPTPVSEPAVVEKPTVVEERSIVEESPMVEGPTVVEGPMEIMEPAAPPQVISEAPVPVAPASAEVIDEVLSFDLNQDGIFDLADFGLLNVQASEPAPTSDSSAIESTPTEITEGEPIAAPTTTPIHSICTAAPPREDVAAFESWLDALAYAWIADAEARQRRHESDLF